MFSLSNDYLVRRGKELVDKWLGISRAGVAESKPTVRNCEAMLEKIKAFILKQSGTNNNTDNNRFECYQLPDNAGVQIEWYQNGYQFSAEIKDYMIDIESMNMKTRLWRERYFPMTFSEIDTTFDRIVTFINEMVV
jgi:hypothetical protein